MQTPRRIFLIGPMGSGKSSIGRHLARRLGYPFRDTDEYLRERTGVDIATIFEFEGESGFRQREIRAVEELSRLDPLVMATGGGTVVSEVNRQLLREGGFVIYLRTSLESQLERTRSARHDRPMLDTPDPEARLRELMEEREPHYRELADLVITTDQRPVKDVVAELQKHLEERL